MTNIQHTIDAIKALPPNWWLFIQEPDRLIDLKGIGQIHNPRPKVKNTGFEAEDLQSLVDELERLQAENERMKLVPNRIAKQAYSKAELVEAHYDGDVYKRAYNDGLSAAHTIAQAALDPKDSGETEGGDGEK